MTDPIYDLLFLSLLRKSVQGPSGKLEPQITWPFSRQSDDAGLLLLTKARFCPPGTHSQESLAASLIEAVDPLAQVRRMRSQNLSNLGNAIAIHRKKDYTRPMPKVLVLRNSPILELLLFRAVELPCSASDGIGISPRSD